MIGTLAWPVAAAMFLSGLDPLVTPSVLGRTGAALLAAVTLVSPIGVALLWLWRSIPIARLRLVEVVFFGLSAATIIWLRYAAISTALAHVGMQGTMNPFGTAYATARANLGWMSLAVVYGVFVPNTWRRTLAVVAVMAVAVVLADAAAWTAYPLVDRSSMATSAMLTFLTLMIGISVAVFGSFKIGELQEEVRVARRQARELGQYHLKERLGIGGMGEVYLAEHQLLKRPCAVKLIRPERADDPKVLARFEREVQATSRLSHPNVVEIYDYGHSDDGTFYYVMEYLDGMSLEDLVMAHGRLPPERALYLMRQLCGALREAHALGLVHRDVKPGNVLICRKGDLRDVVKLVDFGLVRQTLALGAEKLTMSGFIVGTPDYMAPEQAEPEDHVDARSDVYALGGVLHFMLTGWPPFTGNSVMDVLLAHRKEEVQALSEHGCTVPAELEAVMRRCLAKAPADRFADAAVLDEALRNCQGAVPGWSAEQAAAWWRLEKGAS